MGKINIKNILLILSMIYMSSCYVYHKSAINKFELCYNGTYTGIDTLIDINGYYRMNSSFENEKNIKELTVVFYKNGMFLHNPPLEYMIENNINMDKTSGGDWGIYMLSNDTIIGQFVSLASSTSSCESVYYKIIDIHTIQKITTVDSSNFNINKIMQYRPLYHNKFNYSKAEFVPFDNLPNPNKSRIKGKKWFWCDEEDYKKWKRSKK